MRRRLLLFLGGLFLLAVGGGLALLLPARGDLVSARDEMLRGREALVEGDSESAGQAFRRAEEAFGRARDAAGNPLTRFVAVLPIVGRTPDAISGIARSGAAVAQAGQVLASAVEDLPGGVAALAPRRGAIPLQPLERMAGPLGRASALVDEAHRTASDITTAWVPGVVAGPTEEFAHDVAELNRTLHTATALVRALPPFLGSEGERTYFFGAQNPAELRGTGGLLGAYAILRVDEGRIRLGPFQNVSTLEDADASDIDPPNADYARMYDRYGGAGFWKNINMTPDFPSAATAIERLYEHGEGAHLDGTIMADPSSLASLMEITGAVRAPSAGLVEPDDLVAFLSNRAYSIYENPNDRKRLLGQMAERVLTLYLGESPSDPVAAGEALVQAAADGHLLLHAAAPGIQRALEVGGVAGHLPRDGGDRLAVVVNNAGGNKLDFYARRTVAYRVNLLPDGLGEADLSISYVNDAPDEGEPQYVIGPYPGASEAGENVMISSVFCAMCRLHDARLDGAPTGVALGNELGYTVVTNPLRLPSGGSTEVAYGWTLSPAWEGGEDGGVYRLTLLGQPTIRPTRVSIEILVPVGMRVVAASPEMDVQSGRVTWSGTVEGSRTLEVEFARPLPLRIVDTLVPGVLP